MSPDGILALEGTAQGALLEAYETLEDRAPVEGFPNVDQVVGEAPSEVTADLAFLARLVMAGPRRMRMPSRIVLSSYVQPMEWDCPSMDTLAPGPKAAQSIIDCWAPFNQMDSSVAHMHDLYLTLLRVLMVARAEEYPIPFLGFMDRKSFQRVAKDEMCIHNHDFNENAELV